MPKIIGIDFGTSNSSIAFQSPESDEVNLLNFDHHGKNSSILKSAIFFDSLDNGGEIEVGNNAISKFSDSLEGRLIKSFKNFLTDETFKHTKVNNRFITLEELISMIIVKLKDGMQTPVSAKDRIIVGRPVKFVNQFHDQREQTALNRISKSFEKAGMPKIEFVYEPLAAAYTYANTSTEDETVLVADLGGGTTDYCIMLVGPNYNNLPAQQRILATGGVGIAGNALDGKIIFNSVCKELGLGSAYKSYGRDALEVPHWFYTIFSNLANSNKLRDPGNLRLIKEVASMAENKKQLEDFLFLIENNLIFPLFETADQVKQQLSNSEIVQFEFSKYDITLETKLSRFDFNEWIKPELEQMQAALVTTISKAKLNSESINKVFLTGGTSLVPAVKNLYIDYFGKEKVVVGDEFTSVVKGLVLSAGQDE